MTLFRIRFGIFESSGKKKTSFQFGFSLNYAEVNCNSFTVKHVSFIQKAAAAAKKHLIYTVLCYIEKICEHFALGWASFTRRV